MIHGSQCTSLSDYVVIHNEMPKTTSEVRESKVWWRALAIHLHVMAKDVMGRPEWKVREGTSNLYCQLPNSEVLPQRRKYTLAQPHLISRMFWIAAQPWLPLARDSVTADTRRMLGSNISPKLTNVLSGVPHSSSSEVLHKVSILLSGLRVEGASASAQWSSRDHIARVRNHMWLFSAITNENEEALNLMYCPWRLMRCAGWLSTWKQHHNSTFAVMNTLTRRTIWEWTWLMRWVTDNPLRYVHADYGAFFDSHSALKLLVRKISFLRDIGQHESHQFW